MYNLYDYLTCQCIFFVFLSNKVGSYNPQSNPTSHILSTILRKILILTTLVVSINCKSEKETKFDQNNNNNNNNNNIPLNCHGE